MVLVLRFELRLNLVRASGLLVIDCRFELHIPNKSIKAGALTIELDEHKISPLCAASEVRTHVVIVNL